MEQYVLAFVPLLVIVTAARLGWQGVAALWPMLTFAAVMAALIVFLHRANIRRLLAGNENKIGRKKSTSV